MPNLKLIEDIFVKTAHAQTSARLFFSNEKLDVETGKTYTLDIMVDTGSEKAAGVGADITFDPTAVRIVSIKTGSIFADYPVVAKNNTSGQVQISGIVSGPNNLFTGEGLLAQIEIEPLKAGQSSLEFVYSPGSTTDSNIAILEGNGDALSGVGNITLTASGPTVIAPHDATSTAAPGSIENTTIDPYGPITQQTPITQTERKQDEAIFSVSDLPKAGNNTLLIFVFSAVALSTIGIVVFIKIFKKFRTKSNPENENPDNQIDIQ